ncbi:3'(2'),5'-bisphosphate nucleotidase CysQ [Thetidibacter halocola]|uniref:3'(2'),5'-bisphosphate nucleotidase CysQ n=1 Tax=Thetidibacter halocola TaxID=2827239 RepID=A0A8J8BA60_9RHOB|nr:3'(2'),5'-bisphosphate nucleotidase CysQ [Thetidibacter halocola]MBS0126210.1 3'(2'),5'-bisphosphate nucleotidase CysQ [Thetidibacter halocola]
MPGSDLTLLIEAARRAGEIATAHHGGPLDVRMKAHDNSPVTKADLAVNVALESFLRAARPDYGWLSEESPDTDDRLSAERVFVLDPIDGTRSYADGSDTWAHSIAVVEAGRPRTAVVYLPMKDRMYIATRGGGARLNGVPLRAAQTAEPDGASLLATRHSLDTQHWPGGVPDMHRSHRPSLAYRLCLVAEGRYDAMVTFRPAWEWDIAAGALIMAEAGATVTDPQGRSLHFNNRHPQTPGVLAANPTLHAALLKRML